MRSIRSRGPVRESAPFDVPLAGGGFIGVLPDDRSLTTVLAFSPLPPRPAVVDVLNPSVLLPWRRRPEASATELRLMTHETRVSGRGPTATAYRGLLGPLDVVARRDVHLVVRFDASAGAGVVARHGDGSAAALRACVSSTRRLMGLLHAAGVQTSALPASAITTAGPLLDPLANRYDDLDGDPVPLAGDGILIGADDHGSPVPLRLAGLDVPRASVRGDHDLVSRLVVRLAATGVSSAVFTDRPDRWTPLLYSVADRSLLHPAADGPAQVLIDDRPERLDPVSGHTVLRVCRDGDEIGAEPAVVADGPGRLIVSGGGRSIPVRSIATPAESALVHTH